MMRADLFHPASLLCVHTREHGQTLGHLVSPLLTPAHIEIITCSRLQASQRKPIFLTPSLQAIAANEDKPVLSGGKCEEQLHYEPL